MASKLPRPEKLTLPVTVVPQLSVGGDVLMMRYPAARGARPQDAEPVGRRTLLTVGPPVASGNPTSGTLTDADLRAVLGAIGAMHGLTPGPEHVKKGPRY
jgi:hypothetical protein